MSESNVSPSKPALDVHLLGTVAFGDLLALQRRLVYEVGGEPDRATERSC